jgi:hypothetical protein
VTIPQAAQGASPRRILENGETFKFLPVLSAEEASAFWSQPNGKSVLSFGSITGNSKAGSAATEIISDFFGPVRVALMGVIAATDSDKADASAAAQKFIAGGGTAVLTSAWPFAVLGGTNNFLTAMLDPRVGFDFPALGSSTSTKSSNVDLGGDVRGQVLGFSGNLGAIAQFHAARVVGGDNFYSSLGVPKGAFNYTTASIGLLIPRFNIAVMVNRTLSGPAVLQNTNNGQLTVMVVGRK